MTTDDQLAALVAGRIDLGLVSPPFKVPSRMTVYNLPSEPLVAALPAARRAAGLASLADLASALILFPATQGPALHASIIAAFHARGIVPRVVQEATEMATILALVAAGIGNALVPRAAARRLPVTGVTFRPIGRGARLPSWPLALAHMPLLATSPAAALVLRWRRDVDGRR